MFRNFFGRIRDRIEEIRESVRDTFDDIRERVRDTFGFGSDTEEKELERDDRDATADIERNTESNEDKQDYTEIAQDEKEIARDDEIVLDYDPEVFDQEYYDAPEGDEGSAFHIEAEYTIFYHDGTTEDGRIVYYGDPEDVVRIIFAKRGDLESADVHDIEVHFT